MQYLLLITLPLILFGNDPRSFEKMIRESPEFCDFMHAPNNEIRYSMCQKKMNLILSKASESCKDSEIYQLFCVLREEIYKLRLFFQYLYNVPYNLSESEDVYVLSHSSIWKKTGDDFSFAGWIRNEFDNVENLYCVARVYRDNDLLDIAVLPYDYLMKSQQACFDMFTRFTDAIKECKESDQSIKKMQSCLYLGILSFCFSENQKSSVEQAWLRRMSPYESSGLKKKSMPKSSLCEPLPNVCVPKRKVSIVPGMRRFFKHRLRSVFLCCIQ